MRIAFALLPLCLSAGCLAPPEVDPLPLVEDPSLLRAPHGEIGSFFNPWLISDRGMLGGVRWFFTRNDFSGAPRPSVAFTPADPALLEASGPGDDSAVAVWVGHATFAVRDGEDVFLTDPHFSNRALIVPRKTPPGLPVEAIPPDAFAVISHNHYDHLDANSVKKLRTLDWFVPLGLADWFRDRGAKKVVELDWWQTVRHGRFAITCLPSQHWSRRIEQGMNESLWCAWLIETDERRYFHAGDTGYFHGFAEYGRRYGPIDVAMLPIGAYEPRWFMREAHMNPAEAWRAFVDLDARMFLPMHWGTFDLTDEPIDEAPRELARVLADQGAPAGAVRVLPIGGSVEIPPASQPVQPQRAGIGPPGGVRAE